MRVTSHQSLIFADVAADQREELMGILRSHNVPTTEQFSTARRWSMACVAWPTCGLAITESERALPGVMDELEAMVAELGLADEKFTVRMTGCPNGCARPYNADIGLVGKAKEKYTVFLGGGRLGKRLGYIYQDLVHRDDLLGLLKPVFRCFQQQRTPDESFGDFCDRLGKEGLEQAVAEETSETA
ncbi:MAG: hypothetical protein R3B96_17955 [Pirellulaceae bacterium]